uniref:Uncharacterized protein n=1 Tax=viral metagenome TaxID=1070528 RepID=A0A6M3LHT1_9ZZZZ
MGNNDISKQANLLYQDIINGTRNGPVKIIPAPSGYIPPPPDKHKPFNRNPRRYRINPKLY